MVSASAGEREQQGAPDQGAPRERHERPERFSESVRKVMASAQRLANIQARLLALHTKLTIQRIVIFLILTAAAASVGILGLIFLDIGLYHLFTLVMAEHWAFLLHGALHLAFAAGLFIWARSQFNKPGAFLKKPEKPAPTNGATGHARE